MLEARHRLSSTLRAAALPMLLVVAFGCRMVEPSRRARSLLKPLSGSANTLTLEIFSASAPLGDPRIAELWSEVDEQPLSPELRRALADNGIRAGIAGPHIPDTLANLLRVTHETVSPEERSRVALDDEDGPRLLIKQPFPGKRNELKVAESVEELTLLWASEGQVAGKTFQNADCIFDMRAFNMSNGAARVELVPELQFGELKHAVVGSEGMFMYQMQRAKRTFHELKLAAALSPGQMLLITCESDKPLSLGHHYFAQTKGAKPMQKVWVIRMAQAAADRSFAETVPAAASDEKFDFEDL